MTTHPYIAFTLSTPVYPVISSFDQSREITFPDLPSLFFPDTRSCDPLSQLISFCIRVLVSVLGNVNS